MKLIEPISPANIPPRLVALVTFDGDSANVSDRLNLTDELRAQLDNHFHSVSIQCRPTDEICTFDLPDSISEHPFAYVISVGGGKNIDLKDAKSIFEKIIQSFDEKLTQLTNTKLLTGFPITSR